MSKQPLVLVFAFGLAGLCGLLSTSQPSRPAPLNHAQAIAYREHISQALYGQQQLLTLEQRYTAQAVPLADVPPPYRQRNRASSCVHASTVVLLRWEGLYEMADWWWDTYRGGENSSRHTSRLEQAGLRFVVTDDGDEQLLEWAVATRRGAGISWTPAHCVDLLGKLPAPPGSQYAGQTCAVILDNNRINEYIWQPWPEFLQEWHRRGGWAFALCYDPPPPVPTH